MWDLRKGEKVLLLDVDLQGTLTSRPRRNFGSDFVSGAVVLPKVLHRNSFHNSAARRLLFYRPLTGRPRVPYRTLGGRIRVDADHGSHGNQGCDDALLEEKICAKATVSLTLRPLHGWCCIRSWKCLQPGDQMQATKQMERFAEQVKSVLSGGSGSRGLTVNGDTPYKDATAMPFRFAFGTFRKRPDQTDEGCTSLAAESVLSCFKRLCSSSSLSGILTGFFRGRERRNLLYTLRPFRCGKKLHWTRQIRYNTRALLAADFFGTGKQYVSLCVI